MRLIHCDNHISSELLSDITSRSDSKDIISTQEWPLLNSSKNIGTSLSIFSFLVTDVFNIFIKYVRKETEAAASYSESW